MSFGKDLSSPAFGQVPNWLCACRLLLKSPLFSLNWGGGCDSYDCVLLPSVSPESLHNYLNEVVFRSVVI